LAERADLSPEYVLRIEAGLHDPTPGKAARLASRSAGPVASSAGSSPRRTSSRCTRWRTVASTAATSASLGAGAG